MASERKQQLLSRIEANRKWRGLRTWARDRNWRQILGSVQLLSHVRLFATPWTPAHQASLSITNSWSLLKLMSIESVIPSNHLVLCRPLFLLPSIFPSIRVFSSEWVLHIRWPKYWNFSFSISPSNKYSRLISFRIDWFDLLAVQGTLKSLLQHHNSKHQFFSFLYSPTLTSICDYWKNHNFDHMDSVIRELEFSAPLSNLWSRERGWRLS